MAEPTTPPPARSGLLVAVQELTAVHDRYDSLRSDNQEVPATRRGRVATATCTTASRHQAVGAGALGRVGPHRVRITWSTPWRT